MTFEEWWAKQTANFDPEEIGLMQLARVTWISAQDIEREACAKVCEARRRTVSNGNGLSFVATDAATAEAGYCADAIRERSNV